MYARDVVLIMSVAFVSYSAKPACLTVVLLRMLCCVLRQILALATVDRLWHMVLPAQLLEPARGAEMVQLRCALLGAVSRISCFLANCA